MSCDRWREAISARADGEDEGVDAALLDAHLARCRGCRSFAATVASAARRVHPAPVLPDLAPQVRQAVAADDRAGRRLVRVLLVAVAVGILVLALRGLVLGEEHDTGSHAARHLGAFTAAYGVGLLVVAARPARARTMLPVAAVLSAALLITAVVDLVDGRIPLVGEARHLPELASVVLVWLLAVPSGRSAAATSRPVLRAVDDVA